MLCLQTGWVIVVELAAVGPSLHSQELIDGINYAKANDGVRAVVVYVVGSVGWAVLTPKLG